MKIVEYREKWDARGEMWFKSHRDMGPDNHDRPFELLEVTVEEPDQIGLHFANERETLFIFFDADDQREFYFFTKLLLDDLSGQLKEEVPKLTPAS